MRNLSLGGALAALTLLVAASAVYAADIPAKPVYKAAPAPPVLAPAPWSTWTGLYVGGAAGYGWAQRSVAFSPNDFLSQVDTCGGANGGTCPPPTSFHINGALGGPQVGYNWQFSQNWLAGIEADFSWSAIKGTGASNFVLGNFIAGGKASSFSADQNVKWFGTIRGRLGFVPSNNMLLYGTAGFAYARVDENVILNSQPGPGDFADTAFICVTGPNCFLGSSSRTATGWTGGAGFEYALSSNISLKAEYLYVSLGSGDAVDVVAVSTSAVGAPGGLKPTSFTAHYNGTNFQVFRAGINYRFGWGKTPFPVVARY